MSMLNNYKEGIFVTTSRFYSKILIRSIICTNILNCIKIL